MIINVKVVDNFNAPVVPIDDGASLSELFEAAEVSIEGKSITINGGVARPNDMDRSLSDLGVRDGGFVAVLANAKNA